MHVFSYENMLFLVKVFVFESFYFYFALERCFDNA